MRDMLVDIDTVLGSDRHFLLGNWLEDAKRWGSTPEVNTAVIVVSNGQIDNTII